MNNWIAYANYGDPPTEVGFWVNNGALFSDLISTVGSSIVNNAPLYSPGGGLSTRMVPPRAWVGGLLSCAEVCRAHSTSQAIDHARLPRSRAR